MVLLFLDILRNELHYAYRRVRREQRHKLVISRARVVTTYGIATFQSKIAGDRAPRPRPPWNQTFKRPITLFRYHSTPCATIGSSEAIEVTRRAVMPTASMRFLLSAG
jgi:hypothetical protein